MAALVLRRIGLGRPGDLDAVIIGIGLNHLQIFILAAFVEPEPKSEPVRKRDLFLDGFMRIDLGGVAEIVAVPEPVAAEAAVTALDTPFVVVSASNDGDVALRLGYDNLLACYAIGRLPNQELATHPPWPGLLWCPRLESSQATIVNTRTRHAYRDFTLYLRDHAADQQTRLDD